MDLSPLLITEQSPFHSWCRPRRHARAAPLPAAVVPFGRQRDEPRTCHSRPRPCQPTSTWRQLGERRHRSHSISSRHGEAGRHAKFPRHLLVLGAAHTTTTAIVPHVQNQKLFVLQFVLSYPRGLCWRTRRQCLRGETMAWLSSAKAYWKWRNN